ncbi:MAG TPA: thioesterase family protein [Salinisphaeraceae bacterium]|nr:thioesterase family protein [Salinisphaeraceae bacterium]
MQVQAAHIDHMGHVNNAAYLEFMEQAAWCHTEALGLVWEDYQALDAGLVVHRHELDYLGAAFAGDWLQITTWIAANDHRLTLWRGFEMRRSGEDKLLLRGLTRYVCVRLSSGRPRRMPPEFMHTYQALEQAP